LWSDPERGTLEIVNRTKGEHRSGLRPRIQAEAENRPGIYRFLGPRRELLYVGKSIRIRTRLLSYFRDREGKARELLRVASGVEWEYVPNEFEAILREFRLIRAFRPRFNVQHRRHRRFAWIRVTREAAPRIVATRSPQPDGSRFFGPFPATRSLPRALRELAGVVGLRDCPAKTPMAFADQLDLLSVPRSPGCPRADLGSCPAPCASACTREEYLRGVEEVTAFLAGESDAPLERLKHRMDTAVRSRGFEVAARLRDREARLRALRDRVVEAEKEREALSFVYPVPSVDEGSRVYLLQEGRVQLTLDEPRRGDDGARARMAQALRSATDRKPIPPESLSEPHREELFLVARWFRTHPEERARGIPVETYLEALCRDAGGRPTERPTDRVSDAPSRR
jgi:excinuclease ABC subunit C